MKRNLRGFSEDDILRLKENQQQKTIIPRSQSFPEALNSHLGQLVLQVIHLSLQASFLTLGGAEAGILGTEQSLLVPQPDQSRLQLRLLLTVPAEKKKGKAWVVFFSFLAPFKTTSKGKKPACSPLRWSMVSVATLPGDNRMF